MLLSQGKAMDSDELFDESSIPAILCVGATVTAEAERLAAHSPETPSDEVVSILSL